MDFYKLLKYANKLNVPRAKLLSVFFLHIFRKRYLGVFFDPVLACNMRCRMCHFSDEEQLKAMKGIVSPDRLQKIADGFFNRTLKLQIGCAAEPTLYKNLPEIVKMAKDRGVPFISMVTNGNILNKETLEQCLAEGLNEIIISMHGVKKETYEAFMINGEYDKFISVLKLISDAKSRYKFKLRINYTINEDNVEELADFYTLFNDLKLDVLQLRPISKFGETSYKNFSHQKLIDCYDTSIKTVVDESVKRNVICIAPMKDQLKAKENKNNNGMIFSATYCYIGPHSTWRSDFDIDRQTYNSYCKEHHWAYVLFKYHVLGKKEKLSRKKKHLNYQVN